MRIKGFVLAMLLLIFGVLSASAKITAVHSASDLPKAEAIDLSLLGSPYAFIPSGTETQGLTFTTTTGNPAQLDIQCFPPLYTTPANCGWIGNFTPADAYVLWTSGYYDVSNDWLGNGPLTIQFSKPSSGFGFQIMADEAGPFHGTIYAYSETGKFLGSASFSGAYPSTAATFIGLKSDNNNIGKIVIDSTGTLYPHDFGISGLLVEKCETEDHDEQEHK